MDPVTTTSGPEGMVASSSIMGDDRSGLPVGDDAGMAFEVRDVWQLMAELDGRWKA